MWLNGSTAKVLGLFTGHITESFTLRESARRLRMHVSMVHRAIQPLIKSGVIKQDKHKSLSLNYRSHHETLAFAEYLKRDKLLGRGKYRDLAMFTSEASNKIKEESFVLLLFGSAVESDKLRDIDILLIINDTSKVNFYEKLLSNVASSYNLPFEERVVSFDSAYEMLARRDEPNLMNEILNKHIILYGAELFYRIVDRGRP